MTMRAKLERDQETGSDSFNNPLPEDFQALATVSCWAFSKARREVVDGDKTAVLEDLRLMVPLATDVNEKDRVANVLDREGTVLFAGPLRIDSVVRRRRHLELLVQKAV